LLSVGEHRFHKIAFDEVSSKGNASHPKGTHFPDNVHMSTPSTYKTGNAQFILVQQSLLMPCGFACFL